ncbi:unnamed protein product [Ostreobium quekettii]|uniref:Peptidase S1 domain-containing protein n=1 Tax=Ostreobium quekettii TaxID=121088 RepID=A0A8S1JC12_9CHLO|nr:unnamed protein product [Ostreobium quekettii]|eukprot:evm.model.scf_806.3 EVM.evm.TU.scf_806.3   scf_806:19153-23008(-)
MRRTDRTDACTGDGKITTARLGRCGTESAPANRRSLVSRGLQRWLAFLVLAWLWCPPAVRQAEAPETPEHYAGPMPPPGALPYEAEPKLTAKSNDVQEPSFSQGTNLGLWMATQKYRFPAIVSIGAPNQGHTCFGTLIHEEYVLTSAHCLQRVGFNAVVTFRWSGEEVQVVRAKGSKIHPKWKEGGLHAEYDLALLHLQKRVHVNFPTLAALGPPFTPREVRPNQNVFGFRHQDGEILQTAQFKVLQNHLCPNVTISAGILCIFSQDARMEAGVSGGPVLISDWPLDNTGPTKGIFAELDLLVGVVSGNNQSAANSGVGVTPVDKNRWWIDREINSQAGVTTVTLIFVFSLGLAVAWVLFMVCGHRILAAVHHHHVNGSCCQVLRFVRRTTAL